ncbi:MAG: ribosomal RNA small subunit methyltransferase A [Deltaproteobacteria bacterium]|nr:ribosomal RNA small subunit methyltransferase A [Deltaproteobacteria bacterium]MBW2128373.1 ribosomal RNA small subunit methyltransferase A [Deltaproteobacteria bacterium]
MRRSKTIRKGRAFHPKKRLAQHFLRDEHIIKQILSCAGFSSSDHVLEVGPGLGALTIPLARSVRRVIAVEKDLQLVEMLEKRLLVAGVTNVTLIHRDILSFDFEETETPETNKIQVIGNLPYNISSPLLEKLVTHRDRLEQAVLMFQKEFAERLLSNPGGREYGAITVVTRYFSRISPLLEVPREAFRPRPKVGSMVLNLNFSLPYPRRARDERFFRRLVKGAFAQRRKTLLNALSAAFPEKDRSGILEALGRCGIDPSRRAETLDIEEYLSLSEAMAALS